VAVRAFARKDEDVPWAHSRQNPGEENPLLYLELKTLAITAGACRLLPLATTFRAGAAHHGLHTGAHGDHRLPYARPPASAARFISICAFAFAGYAELVALELELDLATFIEVVNAERDFMDLWWALLGLAFRRLTLPLAKHISEQVTHIEVKGHSSGHSARKRYATLRHFLNLGIGARHIIARLP